MKYDVQFRERILEDYRLSEETPTQIAKKFGISIKTILKWINHEKEKEILQQHEEQVAINFENDSVGPAIIGPPKDKTVEGRARLWRRPKAERQSAGEINITAVLSRGQRILHTLYMERRLRPFVLAYNARVKEFLGIMSPGEPTEDVDGFEENERMTLQYTYLITCARGARWEISRRYQEMLADERFSPHVIPISYWYNEVIINIKSEMHRAMIGTAEVGGLGFVSDHLRLSTKEVIDISEYLIRGDELILGRELTKKLQDLMGINPSESSGEYGAEYGYFFEDMSALEDDCK